MISCNIARFLLNAQKANYNLKRIFFYAEATWTGPPLCGRLSNDSAGDKIAVGVSGGKDSLTLLTLLAGLRDFHPAGFTLEALTIDMGLEGMDFSPVAELCRRLNVPYTKIDTQIGPVIFEHRKEKNPCSMCAKMRRGALNEAILDRGISKIALGHHYDDAVETFVMSLIFEGRISCFQPVTYLDRTGVDTNSAHAVPQ